MPLFTIRGLTLEVPEAQVRGVLARALAAGRYEATEADALLRHLRAGDRFLDLGAGLGFLCALAAGVVGQAAVVGVEAGPETVGLARANLARNGFSGVRVVHGAVVADEGAGTVGFRQGAAFWSSGLADGGEAVPAVPIGRLLAEARPTVVCCDIEGSEMEVLARPLPGVRVVVAELHPRAYGPAGVKRVFDALSAQGFAYAPWGSRGATVAWARVPRSAGRSGA